MDALFAGLKGDKEEDVDDGEDAKRVEFGKKGERLEVAERKDGEKEEGRDSLEGPYRGEGGRGSDEGVEGRCEEVTVAGGGVVEEKSAVDRDGVIGNHCVWVCVCMC